MDERNSGTHSGCADCCIHVKGTKKNCVRMTRIKWMNNVILMHMYKSVCMSLRFGQLRLKVQMMFLVLRLIVWVGMMSLLNNIENIVA